MASKIGRIVAYAVLIWVVGFAWGSFVFMTPRLKAVHAIGHISSNPAISFPILVIWFVLVYVFARRYLKSAESRAVDGLRMGIAFSVVNLFLDVLILVFLLKAGISYFFSLTVWIGYLILLITPWLMGRSVYSRMSTRMDV